MQIRTIKGSQHFDGNHVVIKRVSIFIDIADDSAVQSAFVVNGSIGSKLLKTSVFLFLDYLILVHFLSIFIYVLI